MSAEGGREGAELRPRATTRIGAASPCNSSDALPLLEEAFANDRESRRNAGANLVEAYAATGRRDKAEALAATLASQCRRDFRAETKDRAHWLGLLGDSLVAAKSFPEAEASLREALAILNKVEPDGWLTPATQARLGGALLRRKSVAEAEPLLVKGFEGMKLREAKMAPRDRQRLVAAAADLADLYAGLNKPELAAKWRANAAALTAALRRKAN